MTPEEQYKQTVLQQIFDTTTDLLSLVDTFGDLAAAFDGEPLKKELIYFLWLLQRESQKNGTVDPLTRSTNLYGKDEWITPDQIAKE